MEELNPQMPEGGAEESQGIKTAKKVIKTIVIILIILVAAAAVYYLYLSNKYKEVFFDNTTINGVDVSGLTVEEANELVIALEDDYSIKLQFRGRVYETLDGEDMGYGHDATEDIEEILKSQVPVMWIKSRVKEDVSYDHTVECVDFYDRAKLVKSLRALPEVQRDYMKEPTDAYMVLEDNHFVIKPETEGNYIDVETMIKDITAAVDAREPFYSVMRSDVYHKPAVYEDDKELNLRAEELEKTISAEITYQIPNSGTITLDRSTLVEWLCIDDEGNYYKDQDIWDTNVSAFVSNLSGVLASAPNIWEFDTTGMGTITLDFGTYPRYADMDEEYKMLSGELERGDKVTRSPYMDIGDRSQTNHGIGGTYIEADLSRQHVWIYDKGQLLKEFDVISGRPEKKYYTVPGVFYIFAKDRERHLRGPQRSDGSYEWDAFVNYWMPFYDGCGFHDASWQPVFGGDWWLSRGSHGCVNISYDVAQWMYDWVDSSVPLVIYYSSPIPFRDTVDHGNTESGT